MNYIPASKGNKIHISGDYDATSTELLVLTMLLYSHPAQQAAVVVLLIIILIYGASFVFIWLMYAYYSAHYKPASNGAGKQSG